MIKVQQVQDLVKISDKTAFQYISNLLYSLLKNYKSDNINKFGSIYYIESKADFGEHKAFNLSMPLSEKRFEWIEDIGNGYINGCVVINNGTAINLIGKRYLFEDFITED